MPFIIRGTKQDIEVVAELVSIDGSSEQFIVHLSLELLYGDEDARTWTVTHVDTSMALAHAYTVESVIADARARWASKTPEQLADALANARIRLADMLAARGAP